MIKSLTITLVAAGVLTTPVFAEDWTGVYVGGAIGYVNADASGVSDGSFGGGLNAGYDNDMGTWVLGVAADAERSKIDSDDTFTFRAKVRAGYKVGNGLVYGTAGFSHLNVDEIGDDSGYVVGAGYDHKISENFSVGGELSYSGYDNFSSTGTDLDVTTVQMRGAYRF